MQQPHGLKSTKLVNYTELSNNFNINLVERGERRVMVRGAGGSG